MSAAMQYTLYFGFFLKNLYTLYQGTEGVLFGIYMSFSRFQYELLVHTPNVDVYRRILECRFTHFAPYVVALSLGVW